MLLNTLVFCSLPRRLELRGLLLMRVQATGIFWDLHLDRFLTGEGRCQPENDQNWFVGSADSENVFHQMCIPIWVQAFFALPAVLASEVGHTEKAIGRSLAPDSNLVDHRMCRDGRLEESHRLFCSLLWELSLCAHRPSLFTRSLPRSGAASATATSWSSQSIRPTPTTQCRSTSSSSHACSARPHCGAGPWSQQGSSLPGYWAKCARNTRNKTSGHAARRSLRCHRKKSSAIMRRENPRRWTGGMPPSPRRTLSRLLPRTRELPARTSPTLSEHQSQRPQGPPTKTPLNLSKITTSCRKTNRSM